MEYRSGECIGNSWIQNYGCGITYNESSSGIREGIDSLQNRYTPRLLSKILQPQEIARAVKLGVQHGIAADTGRRVFRSTKEQFNFSTDCVFCGKQAMFGVLVLF